MFAPMAVSKCMAPCKGMAAGKAPKAETRKNQMTETNKLNKRRKPGDCRRAGNAAAPPKRDETRQQAGSAALKASLASSSEMAA